MNNLIVIQHTASLTRIFKKQISLKQFVFPIFRFYFLLKLSIFCIIDTFWTCFWENNISKIQEVIFFIWDNFLRQKFEDLIYLYKKKKEMLQNSFQIVIAFGRIILAYLILDYTEVYFIFRLDSMKKHLNYKYVC